MGFVLDFLVAQPLVALIAILAVGLALGKIRVLGISLGAAAVLFVALGTWLTVRADTAEVHLPAFRARTVGTQVSPLEVPATTGR